MSLIVTITTAKGAEQSIELVGPTPPPEYKDNGCSMSPDGWWRAACRVHDYEYSLIREKIELYRCYRKKTSIFALLDGEYKRTKGHLKQEIKWMRKEADTNLKENIQLLSKGSKMRAAFAWIISRRYYGAVRRWGRFALGL